MEKRFEEFKTKINRKLNAMDAKIAFINENLGGLRSDLKDFKNDFDDFIDFTHESYQDHEKRIASLEKKVS